MFTTVLMSNQCQIYGNINVLAFIIQIVIVFILCKKNVVFWGELTLPCTRGCHPMLAEHFGLQLIHCGRVIRDIYSSIKIQRTFIQPYSKINQFHRDKA